MQDYQTSQDRQKLLYLTVRLDDAIWKVEATWADFIRQERHIGDFTDEARYDESFQRLLRDLREGQR